ncbi:hypothetical protein C1893_17900 [Pseudomonas sp. MPR-ANC1]|nr:hypothetical protein C1893_17900 [Pseudomonas sp. MPR-ANC1]
MIDHCKDRCRQGVDNGLGKNPLRRVFFRLSKSTIDYRANYLWRGSLLPLGREAAHFLIPRSFSKNAVSIFRAAAQPIGDKSPRHRGSKR